MIVIQARGFIVLRHRDDDGFFKGGGNYRGSKGLVEDRSEQTSELISAWSQNPGLWSRQVQPLSWCSLPLVPSEPRPPTRWSHDSRFSVFCCFLTRCSAEPRCRRCNQSGRRRCLIFGQRRICTHPPRRICSQRHRWSLNPCHMRRESLSWKWDSIPLFVTMFGGTYCSSESITRCFVHAHIPRQKSLVVCGSAFVNRITDWSVHPRFLIRESPYSNRFCSLFG